MALIFPLSGVCKGRWPGSWMPSPSQLADCSQVIEWVGQRSKSTIKLAVHYHQGLWPPISWNLLYGNRTDYMSLCGISTVWTRDKAMLPAQVFFPCSSLSPFPAWCCTLMSAACHVQREEVSSLSDPTGEGTEAIPNTNLKEERNGTERLTPKWWS